MLKRIRQQVVRPWIRRPKGAALVVTLLAALATSSALAQCRGGSGGMGGSGMGGSGGAGGVGGAGGFAGAGGAGGMGFASLGAANGGFAVPGQGQGNFSAPTDQMFQPAFHHVVDDNRQYLAERRSLRATKVEQARQRLASRKERPAKHRVAANFFQE